MIFILSESVYATFGHFLLMISSNLGLIFYRFRDTATYSLKLCIKNCHQTAADGDMVIACL